MDVTERSGLEDKVGTKKQLDRLLAMDEFKDIFLTKFLKTDLLELVYREGSSDGVIRAMEARKVFNDFVYDIIDQGAQAQETLKDN